MVRNNLFLRESCRDSSVCSKHFSQHPIGYNGSIVMVEPSPARKGARSRADVTPQILRQLNAGTLETASLPEGLIVDFAKLMAVVAPEVPKSVAKELKTTKSIVARMNVAGRALGEHLGLDELPRLVEHRSDTVRGWSAYLIAHAQGLSLAARFKLIRPLAADVHFGVREWAWLALRPHVAQELDRALHLLTSWTGEPDANIRRFASEITRPRGVWCEHIAALKREPELAESLLEPLHADPERYVQNSVANWLNDAAKSQPDWVKQLCGRWQRTSRSPHTSYIVRRALRSLT